MPPRRRRAAPRPRAPSAGVTLTLSPPAPLAADLREPVPTSTWLRYEDLGVLGRGAMGEVHRVRDRILGRTLAMKLLVLRGAGAAGLRAGFLAEARLAASLAHPGIVPVHDCGATPEGGLWFTMDEVRGRSLRAAIQDAHGAGGASPSARRRLADVYVPAGWFAAGGDAAAPESLPAQRVWVDGFVIGRFPVTVAAYRAFLNDLVALGREDEADAVCPCVPRSIAGAARVPTFARGADGRYLPPEHAAADPGRRSREASCAWRPRRPAIPRCGRSGEARTMARCSSAGPPGASPPGPSRTVRAWGSGSRGPRDASWYPPGFHEGRCGQEAR